MADNVIDSIREAELEAEKILLQAVQESDRIKDEAYIQAVYAGRLAEAAAKTAANDVVFTARENSLHALHKAEAAIEGELKVLRQKAGNLREQAIETVINSLV